MRISGIRPVILLALLSLLGGALLLARRADAQDLRLQYGDRVEGQITVGGAPDVWRFSGAAGDRITIRFERLEGDLAPALLVSDPQGEVLLDVAWPTAPASVSEVTLRLASGGEHGIELSAQQGGPGSYALSLLLAQPGEPAGRSDVALSYGQSVRGTLADPNPEASWSFRGQSGDVIDVTVTPESEAFQSVVTLISPTGSTVASGTALSAARLPMEGIYTLDLRAPGADFGAYELNLRLRSSTTVDTGFIAAPLNTGEPARGRLTSDAPSARYRVTGSGALALALDLADPRAQVSVALLSENRALLDTFTAIGQMRVNLPLGGLTTVWLEITSPGLLPEQPLDFEVEVNQLRLARREARALLFNVLRRVTPAADPDVWFFDARAGDLIAVALHPETASPEGVVQLYGPDGDLLLQRQIDAGFDQPLLLESTGIYEVLIRATGADGYSIGLTQSGAEGASFDLILDRADRGPLSASPELQGSGELGARAAEEWTLDIREPGVWSFALSTPAETGPLGLRVETPGGNTLRESFSQPVSGRAAVEVAVEAPGRYRILVINPALDGTIPYTLQTAPVGGGALTAGETVHGVLLETLPQHAWEFQVAGPAIVRTEVRGLAGDALPELALVAPDGLLAPLLATSAADPGSLSVPVEESGAYRLVARQPAPGGYTAYALSVSLDSPEEPSTLLTTAVQTDDPLTAIPEPMTEPITVNPRDQILPATRPGLDVLADAQLLALESTVRGTIPVNAHYQVWRFQAQSGQLFSITAVGLARESAPDLTVLDEQGSILARSFSPERSSNTLLHRFGADGRIYVVVRYDPGGRYLLRVEDRSALDPSVGGLLPGHVITFGETLRGELLSPDTPVHVYFYGHAGDSIRAEVVRQLGAVSLQLETAGGRVLATSEADPARPARAVVDFRLGNDGLYRLVVQPDAPDFSPGTFALHLTLRQATADARDGRRLEGEVFGTLSGANPSDTWLFAATAGERISLVAEPIGSGAPALSVELAGTTGTPFLQRDTLIGAPVLTLDGISLPRSGVYRVVVRAARGEGGSYRLRTDSDPGSLNDTQHVLPLNQTVSKVLTRTNTLDIWTFAGTEGDVLSAEARVTHGDMSQLSFQIRTQNGEVLATVAADGSGRAAAPQVLLPATGHYTLAVGNLDAAFQGALAYELAVLLESTQARSMGAVLAPSGVGAGMLGGADLRDVWLFEGRQGDIVRVTVTAQDGGVAASVLSTDWHIAGASGRPDTLAVGDQDEPGALALEPVILPANGVYTIDVSAPPAGVTTYTLSLTLESVSALPAASISPGQQIEGRISDENIQEAWTFEGQQGDVVSLRVVSDSRGTLAPLVSLYGPGGAALMADSGAPGGEIQLASYALPENGLYTIAIGRRLGARGGTAGRYRADLALEPAPAIATRLLRYGQVGRSWINASAPVEHWVFEGDEGDVIEASVEVLSGTLDPVLRLYGPEQVLLASVEAAGDIAPRLRLRLRASGTYRLEVARAAGVYGATQGNYALTLDRTYRFGVLPDLPMLAYGQRVTDTVDEEAPADVWAFVGAAGDVVRIWVRFPADDAPLTLSALDPGGTVLASGTRAGSRAVIDNLILPYSGVYLVELRQGAGARSAFGPYELTLALAGSGPGVEQSGGLLEPIDPVYGRFDVAPEAHLWLLRAEEGQRAVLSLARLAARLEVDLRMLAPDGTVLLETSPAPGAAALTTEPIVFPEDGLYVVVIAARDEALGLRYRLQLDPLDLPPLQPAEQPAE